MSLQKGWLDKQFSKVAEEISEWPVWMQKEAGFEAQQPKSTQLQTKTSQACVVPGLDSNKDPVK